MTGPGSFLNQFRAFWVVAAILLFLTANGAGVMAEDAPASPDTPVSSDTASPSTDVTNEPGTPVTGAPKVTDGTAQGNAGSAEIGSQATKKAQVSHEQEEKDRMFVDATFIAVAIILCIIAFFLFLSLPKQPKKAGSDNQ